MAQARQSHLREGYADEGPREKRGMGDGKPWLVEHLGAVEQQVDVDDPWSLALVRRANPPAGTLDAKTSLKQRPALM
jgi:hypothetical protein